MEPKEYIVTLHNFEDLDSFYEDMESPGGSLYIPDRAVELAQRRPISRNTHYMLTAEEAEQLKADPRVLDVELNFKDAGWEIRPRSVIDRSRFEEEVSANYVQTSTAWDKSASTGNTMRNWGLLRCYEGTQRSGWGVDGTVGQSGTIQINSSGKNVDVVIVDGHMNPAHPEFAVNPDGTGGSRVVQFNWLSLTNAVNGGANGTYVYTPYVDNGNAQLTSDNNHGAHVAGTVAGNTQGWARDATIYNLSPYPSAPSYVPSLNDYIRYWHQTKAINPATGRRNPTITNHSYGITSTVEIATITSIRYRGVTYTGPFTGAQLWSYGLSNDDVDAEYEIRSTSWETDFIELINAGVIVIGSAGNSSSRIVTSNASASDDYNNYFVSGGNTYYYMRGTISAASNVICVGCISQFSDEAKSSFSNYGTRISVWAPGHFIISSVNSGGVADSRNGSYLLGKKNGTSMASPQVAGVIACLAENWPRVTQSDVVTWLTNNGTYNQIGSDVGSNYYDLQDSPNRYLYFKQPRLATGNIYPAVQQGNRPTSGMTFPRTKIYRYGS